MQLSGRSLPNTFLLRTMSFRVGWNSQIGFPSLCLQRFLISEMKMLVPLSPMRLRSYMSIDSPLLKVDPVQLAMISKKWKALGVRCLVIFLFLNSNATRGATRKGELFLRNLQERSPIERCQELAPYSQIGLVFEIMRTVEPSLRELSFMLIPCS